MEYWQVDVFAERVLAGNGLAVFPDCRGLSPAAMQELTRELRQFESIFLAPLDAHNAFSARVFTVEEELPFAGHPILGAAALLHQLHGGKSDAEWLLQLPEKQVRIATRRNGKGFYAEMDQGPAQFGQVLDDTAADSFAAAFGSERDRRYPAQVVSTGLPYLLLPVTAAGLATAKQRESVDDALAGIGAAFVFLMDVDAREGRTWDPLGVVEDIATGSAAGPVAAWRVAQGLERPDQPFALAQGRFLGRPSRLDVCVTAAGNVLVGGEVQLLAHARLLPPLAELG
ncbi:PhzF family phenazine biosynthesis protein [Pseudomonas resinovorans]|uniref:PhzF family phenazine biosynthesis protein n=1 Tax=Metapseudomonas resinovorans TaxID=53412 RepID=A0ABT4XZX4_METRE|nr:PhzF family phenazine biosynthesis protein [Pseudomonas resinovorans]MDA8482133.1 PhzF family phenazine biosynthesis protein [Pseudomonas resinovorans]